MRNLKHYFILACSVLFIMSLPMLAQAQKDEDLVGWWTFEKGVELKDLIGNFPDLELMGAKIDDGALDVDAGKWAYTVGNYTGPEVRNKTLVSWASLDNLNVQSGSILTIDRIVTDMFDAIVFGERQVHRWMAGSNNFTRTQDPAPGFEEKKTGEKVLMAYSYEDKGGQTSIKLYRNGEIFGDYTFGPIGTWVKNDTEVIFGKRHGLPAVSGPGQLDAHIYEARIYGVVLSQAEIKILREGGQAVEARDKLATVWGAIKAKYLFSAPYSREKISF